MSMLLRTTTPGQTAGYALHAKGLPDEPGQAGLPSFCEVLIRSLNSGAELAASMPARSAGFTPLRRQSGDEKAMPAELVNGMVMSFVALQSRVPVAAPDASRAATQAARADLARALELSLIHI